MSDSYDIYLLTKDTNLMVDNIDNTTKEQSEKEDFQKKT